jgi:hypothetical protein
VALYKIRRCLGKISRDELDAAGYRALVCSYQFEDLVWLRSYWQPELGEITCIYEARDEAQLIEHSLQSRIPCDEISPVTEVTPLPLIHG